MLTFKDGVKAAGLQPEILTALDIAEAIYQAHGHNCTVTSSRGDKHSAKYSRHYAGMAVDLRTRIFTAAGRETVFKELKAALGEDYNLIYEGGQQPHFHLAYKPVYHSP